MENDPITECGVYDDLYHAFRQLKALSRGIQGLARSPNEGMADIQQLALLVETIADEQEVQLKRWHAGKSKQ